jgi:hypothetical protein
MRERLEEILAAREALGCEITKGKDGDIVLSDPPLSPYRMTFHIAAISYEGSVGDRGAGITAISAVESYIDRLKQLQRKAARSMRNAETILSLLNEAEPDGVGSR